MTIASDRRRDATQHTDPYNISSLYHFHLSTSMDSSAVDWLARAARLRRWIRFSLTPNAWAAERANFPFSLNHRRVANRLSDTRVPQSVTTSVALGSVRGVCGNRRQREFNSLTPR